MTQSAEALIDTYLVVVRVTVTALEAHAVLAVAVDVVLGHAARAEKMVVMATRAAVVAVVAEVVVVVVVTRAPRRPRTNSTLKWTITLPRTTARLLLRRMEETLVPRAKAMPRSLVLVTLT